MHFVWDEEKNDTNIRKHGIDFIDAATVFKRPMYTDLDDRIDYGEDRWVGLGILPNGIIIVIVFTEPDADTIRIVSARRAKKFEEREYHEKIGH